METMTLRQRATLVEALSSSLTHGGTALSTVPKALRRLLDGSKWADFVTSRGEPVHWDRFSDFVAALPPKGLGSSQEQLYRIAPELEDQLDQAFGRKQRKDKIVDNLDNIQESVDLEAPTGTSKRAALRRLRKDRPDLHERVLAGEISANWAMIEAKFRPKTITVAPSRPEAMARSLRKYMSTDDIIKLILLLGAED